MPLIPAALEPAIKTAVFNELQAQFLPDVPAEHQQQVTDQHTKLAGAVAKMAGEIVTHLTQNLTMAGTGIVSTVVNTIVALAGAGLPGALAGTGTGAGSGTCTASPGAFTMPGAAALLEVAMKGVVFAELQAQFLPEVPPENQQQVTEQHDKIATAVSKAATEIVNHIQQNLTMAGTGIVQTTVSTIIATAGSPTAHTGTGTGSGTGTCTANPGAFT